MPDTLSSSVIKAIKGEYDIPIKACWANTWRQLFQMPKTFWQVFGLIILILFGGSAILGCLVRIYDSFNWFALSFSNSSALLILHRLSSFLPTFLSLSAIEILRFLLILLLAFFVLKHHQHQSLKSTCLFILHQAWRPLLLISGLFYLVYSVINLFLGLFFKSLIPLTSIYTAFFLYFIIFTLVATYILLIFFMASLLILDQKVALKNSLKYALKAINKHTYKNVILLLPASLMYRSGGSDLALIFYSFKDELNLYLFYLVLIPGVILAILFFLTKIIASKNKPSRFDKIILMSLKFILGLVILGMLFLVGGGSIWLVPVIALLMAIQYQHTIWINKSYVSFCTTEF